MTSTQPSPSYVNLMKALEGSIDSLRKNLQQLPADEVGKVLVEQDDGGHTLLHHCAIKGLVDAARVLLEFDKKQCSVQDGHQSTPLVS